MLFIDAYLMGVVDVVIVSDPVTRIGFRFDPAAFAATADEAEIEKIFLASCKKWRDIKLYVTLILSFMISRS